MKPPGAALLLSWGRGRGGASPAEVARPRRQHGLSLISLLPWAGGMGGVGLALVRVLPSVNAVYLLIQYHGRSR